VKWFRKREVRLPTPAGCLVLAAAAVLLAIAVLRSVYPFLSAGSPVENASLLIIEGWIPDESIGEVLAAWSSGQRIVTAGGPIPFGGDLLEQNTYAEVTAVRLQQAGADPADILCAPAPPAVSDRTWTSALAVRRRLEKEGLHGVPCNLCTFGAHTRRSLYLYRKAFGSDWSVGAVPLETGEYDLQHWWTGSLGFKHVLSELLSWVYTQCTFWKYTPPESSL
jgi:hypothetical protein